MSWECSFNIDWGDEVYPIVGMVNPLAKKNEITIQNTIGPNNEIITIAYKKGMTAGDIEIVDFQLSKDEYILEDIVKGVLAPNDVISPNARLVLIPSLIGGSGDLMRANNINNDLKPLIDKISDIFHLSKSKLSEILFKDIQILDDWIQDNTLNQDETINKVLELIYQIKNLKSTDSRIQKLGIDIKTLRNDQSIALTVLENYLFRAGGIFEGGSREIFNLFAKIAFLKSEIKGEFINFDMLNSLFIKDSLSLEYDLKDLIQNREILNNDELMDIRRNILEDKFSHPQLVKEINDMISNRILQNLRDNDVEFINLFGEDGTRAMIMAGTDQDQLNDAFKEILEESPSLRREVDPSWLFGQDRREIQNIFNAYRTSNGIANREQPLSLIYFEGEKDGVFYKALFFIRKIEQPVSGLRRTPPGQIELLNDDFYSRRYAGVRIGYHEGSSKYLIPSLLGLETYEKYSIQELIQEKIQAECTERVGMINFDLFLLNNHFDSGKVVLASEWWLCDVCKYNYRLFEENCARNSIIAMLVDGTSK